MASIYSASVDQIALVATTAKSIFELGTTANNRKKIISWSLTFDGVTPSAVPVKCEIGRFSAGITTGSAYTADKYDPADGPDDTTAKTNATVEGAGTPAGVEIFRIPPTGGMLVQYPLGREMVVPVSSFWRMRLTAAAGVNVTFTVAWEQ